MTRPMPIIVAVAAFACVSSGLVVAQRPAAKPAPPVDTCTLVVDVRSLDDTTWLTDNGAIHSDQTRVVERLRRDGHTLHYEATVYDPVYFAEPWKMTGRVLPLLTTYDIEEAPHCVERDRPNIPDLGHHGNIR